MRLDTEQLERLITRSLDGEILEPERLVLQRELVESPEARRLFEEHQQIHRAARDALQGLLADARPAVFPLRRQRRLPWRALVPGVLAAAAAIALMVMPRMSPSPSPSSGLARQDRPPLKLLPAEPPHELPGVMDTSGASPALVDYVEHPVVQPRRMNRHLTRDWIGIMDETGQKVFWLQRHHRQTSIVPVTAEF